jgi:hypothetical protein
LQIRLGEGSVQLFQRRAQLRGIDPHASRNVAAGDRRLRVNGRWLCPASP